VALPRAAHGIGGSAPLPHLYACRGGAVESTPWARPGPETGPPCSEPRERPRTSSPFGIDPGPRLGRTASVAANERPRPGCDAHSSPYTGAFTGYDHLGRQVVLGFHAIMAIRALIMALAHASRGSHRPLDTVAADGLVDRTASDETRPNENGSTSLQRESVHDGTALPFDRSATRTGLHLCGEHRGVDHEKGQAPGPQSRHWGTSSGPMRSSRLSARRPVRNPSSITG
jgi:hypothetical protein